MKSKLSLRRATAIAGIVLGLAMAAPTGAVAGTYEEALAAVERAYGPIGDTNTAEPGGVEWRVRNLTIKAKEMKASGDDAAALAKILQAETTAVSTQ